MSVGSAKEGGGTMIKRAAIEDIVIHETLTSTRQPPDAHVT